MFFFWASFLFWRLAPPWLAVAISENIIHTEKRNSLTKAQKLNIIQHVYKCYRFPSCADMVRFLSVAASSAWIRASRFAWKLAACACNAATTRYGAKESLLGTESHPNWVPCGIYMKLHLLSVRLVKEAALQLPFLFKRCVIFVHPECKYSADRILIDKISKCRLPSVHYPSPHGPTLECMHAFLVTNDFILHSCLARCFSSLASDRQWTVPCSFFRFMTVYGLLCFVKEWLAASQQVVKMSGPSYCSWSELVKRLARFADACSRLE